MNAESEVVWGAVVVAAGRGVRFGADKLLALLHGRPVICWTVEALAQTGRFREIVVVLNNSTEEAFRAALSYHVGSDRLLFCDGGESRSASVGKGLNTLSPAITHVAVHDGARPLVTPALVESVLDEAQQFGAAVPAVDVKSTIGVRSSGGPILSGKLDRARLCEIQTPQASKLSVLRACVDRFPDETDESSALLRAGVRVSIVPGSRSNIKITDREDLIVVDALLSSKVVS